MRPHSMVRCALMLALASCAARFAGAQTPPTNKDTAHLVSNYTIYQQAKSDIVRSSMGQPGIVVTTEHWIVLAPVKDGTALTVMDLDTGAGPLALELADIGGTSAPTADKNVRAFSWFLLVPKSGEVLRTDGRYEVTIHYEKLTTWTAGDPEDATKGVLGPVLTAPVKVIAAPLPPGKKIENSGDLADAKEQTPKIDAPTKRHGLQGLLDAVDVELTPLVTEESDELGLAYRAKYEIDRKRFGGSLPGYLAADLAIEGRVSSDFDDPSMTGYSRGDLNVRGMWLLGNERYYPVGLRAAVGYEGDEKISDAEATGTAQVVVSVPYVGDVLEFWQETLGFTRAFAPPYVSAAFVSSHAELGGVDQDRWELEVGWIAPIASTFDVNVRWRRQAFTANGQRDEDLLELDLTYYPGGDLHQGLRMTFEEGFRAAVGDIGSRIFVGYTLSF